jgi:hypothetical protein
MGMGLEMRKLLAVMVLVCGTASADAAETLKWCTDGAQLLLSDDDSWILWVDGKPDERLTGPHDITGADLILYDETTEQRQNDLVYARGRIFRSCQLKGSAPPKRSDREAELEAANEKIRAQSSKLQAAIDKIRTETSKPGQTLPKLRRAIGSILQDLKR